MSFDSDDAEEFYDACEDVSPAKLSEPSLKSGYQDDILIGTKELEDEEKRLLDLKKLTEERRRREDEDLQQRLLALETKKKRDNERKAQDLEKRKRKLQKMRELVTEENTLRRPKELECDDWNNAGEVVCASADPGQCDIGQCDSDLVSVGSSDSASDPSLSQNDTDKEHLKHTFDWEETQLTAAAEEEKEEVSEHDEAVKTDDDVKAVDDGSPAAAAVGGDVGSLDVVTCSGRLQHRDLCPDDTDTPPPPEQQPPPYQMKILAPEPDIVQSSKPRPVNLPQKNESSHQLLLPPKAPPRRKKKKAPTTCPAPNVEPSLSQVSDILAVDQDRTKVHSSATSTARNVTKVHSPTSTVLNLTKDFECSLDLLSATCGNRMVQSTDNDSTRAETAEEDSLLDEDALRPRTNSGSRFLTDKEILDQVSVLNLDTGERVPLSLAEEALPQGINPLALHIMRRTKEYSSDSSLHKELQSDDEEGSVAGDTPTLGRQAEKLKQKGIRLRKLLGKKVGKTMTKIKMAAEEVLQKGESSSDEEDADGKKTIKIKAARSHSGPYDFINLKPVQDLTSNHPGAVWTMKFSHCGRLLAAGGQDNVLRVWVLKESLSYFDEMRRKYSESAKLSPAYSQESLNSAEASDYGDTTSTLSASQCAEGAAGGADEEEYKNTPFVSKAFCMYRGHTADLLDISWSKNYFILSSSMDKTVRLWHISRRECLCCFQHIDFVTAIAFHPKDDRYFLSGSLDGKLRLWNIPDKKVALWNEVSGPIKLITAANFCQNGKFAVVGTYDGRCILYNTEQLKYYTQIYVRSTRGKNARGRKVTGVEPVPGEDKILVTSNDSRLRLYDLRDLTLTCKYKGCANNSSQIKASFSSNGKYMVCGSEDCFVYIWKTHHNNHKFSSVRRDRNGFWEAIRAHSAVVTAAIFAPNPSLIIRSKCSATNAESVTEPRDHIGEVLVTADFTGVIKIFKNKFRPSTNADEKV